MSQNLPERALRERVNKLRSELDQKERELSKAFKDLSLHRTSSKRFREERDRLNSEVRALGEEASILKMHRDIINQDIARLKKRREGLQREIRVKRGIIDNAKNERDRLNEISKGKYDKLLSLYTENLETFISADITLEHEIDLFNQLIKFGERINAAKEADQKHRELRRGYKHIKAMQRELEMIHERIQRLADESQQYHEKLVDTYKKIDLIRAESDEYHKKLIETYKITDPLRDRIDNLKKTIKEMRERLSTEIRALKDAQLKREEAKNEERRIEARERYLKTGKMSIEDLRILLENRELKL